MELSERCGMCGSYKWCGRACKYAPAETKSAEREAKVSPPPAPPKRAPVASAAPRAPAVKSPEERVVELKAAISDIRAGKYDRNAAHRLYMKDYMRKRRGSKLARGPKTP